MSVPVYQDTVNLNRTRLQAMLIDSQAERALDKIAGRLLSFKVNYLQASAATHVPVAVIMAIHERESSANFDTWLHNGDPCWDPKPKKMIRTTHVPKNRPPNIPCSWASGAIDALSHYGLGSPSELLAVHWAMPMVCYLLERYNGFGYFNRSLPSPYLWSWSNIYQRGKYVTDGKFDPHAVDRQVGAIPLMRRIMLMDPLLRIPEL